MDWPLQKKRPADKPPSFVISMVRNSLVQKKKEIYLTQCLLKSGLKLARIDYSCNIDRFMDHCCSCPIMATEWTTPGLHHLSLAQFFSQGYSFIFI